KFVGGGVYYMDYDNYLCKDKDFTEYYTNEELLSFDIRNALLINEMGHYCLPVIFKVEDGVAKIAVLNESNYQIWCVAKDIAPSGPM
ncbi:MAG: hypothetical protein IKU41_02955, partial [Clostridia bacterium]|nr:hypothetical protein [Clostridia bacterium]